VAPNFSILLLAGLIGAVSRAVVAPVSLTIAGTWFSGGARERAIGLVSASIAGAAGVGVPLMTRIAALSNWRFAFVALGIPAAWVSVVTRRALPATQPLATSKLRLSALLGTYRQLLRDRPTLNILGANLLRSTGIWSVGTYIITFLVIQHGLSVQQASLAFAAAGAGVFLGSLIAGTPLRAMSPRMLLVGCSVFGTGLVALTMALPMPAIGVFGLL